VAHVGVVLILHEAQVYGVVEGAVRRDQGVLDHVPHSAVPLYPADGHRHLLSLTRQVDSGWPGNRAARDRPVCVPCRVGTDGKLAKDQRGIARSDCGPAAPGQSWRRGSVSPAGRALPTPPAVALLSHPRVLSRRGGRAAGDLAVRLARARRLRGACLGPDVAVPGRNELLPEAAALTTAEPERGPAKALARAAGADPARRSAVARALSRPSPRSAHRHRPRAGGAIRSPGSGLACLHHRVAVATPPPPRRADP